MKRWTIGGHLYGEFTKRMAWKHVFGYMQVIFPDDKGSTFSNSGPLWCLEGRCLENFMICYKSG